MNALHNLKMSAKLSLAFAFLLLITAMVGLIGIYDMGSIAAMTERSYHYDTQAIIYLKQANIRLFQLAISEKNLLLAQKPEARERFLKQIPAFRAQVNEQLNLAKPLLLGKENQTYEQL